MSEINIKNIKPGVLPKKKVVSGNTSNSSSFFKKDKINDQIKLEVYKELSILSNAGVEIKNALDLIIANYDKENVKKTFALIRDSITKGANISDAFERTSKFTDYEIYSLKIGEETGTLNEVLSGLAFFYERRIKLKRIFVNAISYPAFLLLSTLAVVFFMLTFVVPMFEQMFNQFDAELPYITKVLLAVSDFMVNQMWIMIGGIGMIGFLIYRIRNNIRFRKITSAYVLKIPFIGELIRIIYIARFCQAMHLLIKSKTSIINSLKLVKKMIGFYPIEQSIDEITMNIITGKSFSASMEQHAVYGKRMVSLIKVAEEVNKLDTVFNELTKQYTEEADYKTSIISTFLQPVMLIIIGAIIGFIVVGMYLPMIELGGVAF
jgi:type IV pilus assembly protein PilC